MTGKEIDEMLHKIREEVAKDTDGMTPEERNIRDLGLFEKDVEEFGFRTLDAPRKVVGE